jgi:hypothetical protein
VYALVKDSGENDHWLLIYEANLVYPNDNFYNPHIIPKTGIDMGAYHWNSNGFTTIKIAVGA